MCANTFLLKELNYRSSASGRKMVGGQFVWLCLPVFWQISWHRMIFLTVLFLCQEGRVTEWLDGYLILFSSMCGLFLNLLSQDCLEVSVVFFLFVCWLVFLELPAGKSSFVNTEHGIWYKMVVSWSKLVDYLVKLVSETRSTIDQLGLTNDHLGPCRRVHL